MNNSMKVAKNKFGEEKEMKNQENIVAIANYTTDHTTTGTDIGMNIINIENIIIVVIKVNISKKLFKLLLILLLLLPVLSILPSRRNLYPQARPTSCRGSGT